MKHFSLLIICLALISLIHCKKINDKKLEGNWSLSVPEFEFHDLAHRDAFFFHDTDGTNKYFLDTDMIISVKYFLPKNIDFFAENNQLNYKSDNSSGTYVLNTNKIKIGETLVLCDCVYFDDGYYTFGRPITNSGCAQLKGKFKDKSTFEGDFIITNIYQKTNDKVGYNGIPYFTYYLNKVIPVKLVKQ